MTFVRRRGQRSPMLKRRRVYLDYAASTPLDLAVIEAMSAYLRKKTMGNAAALQHSYGRESADIVNMAAKQVAQLISAKPEQLIWTSGATEANNLALRGAADALQHRGKHIVTTAIEHKSVLSICQYLQTQGYTVTIVKPQANGIVAVDDIANAMRDDTILVSVMHVNNETGAIQDIAKISQLVHQHNALLHVDAAQSAARLPLNVNELNIDLLSLSAHKMYGPTGIGALYVAPTVRLTPLLYGGEQQRGLRPGTLPTLAILGMGVACQQVRQSMVADNQRINQLTHQLWDGLQVLGDVILNGDLDHLAPGFLNVTFRHIAAPALLTALTDVAVATGSACTSTSVQVSHVLLAMERRRYAAHNAIRFSLGRMTTQRDIENAISHVKSVVTRLRSFSPLWELAQTGVDVDQYSWESAR